MIDTELVEKRVPALKLSDATVSRWYRIESLDGPETECRRLQDLGFTPGEDVAVVRTTPLGDPLVVIVRGTQLALRRREASWIRVLASSEADRFARQTPLQ